MHTRAARSGYLAAYAILGYPRANSALGREAPISERSLFGQKRSLRAAC